MTVSNQQGTIAKAAENKVQAKKNLTIKDYINQMQGEIAKALPSVMTPERFTRIALSAVSNTPKLGECTPQSFLSAMMNAAQLGLEPNTPLGQAYLIPYGKQVQFQIGAKGLTDLAYRSGEIKTIYAQTVYENDVFEYELGLDPKLKHIPAKENRGKPIYFYAVFKLVNGGEAFECMSIDDVRKHAQKYSKSYSNGPWHTDFEAMAKKTVIKKVLKYAPLKSDFARQLSADETIKNEISSDMSTVPNEYYDLNEDTGELSELKQEVNE